MKKSNFDKLYSSYEKVLVREANDEDVASDGLSDPDAALPPPVGTEAAQAAQDAANTPAEPEPTQDEPQTQEPAQETPSLSSEGEVTLIRLLKQAFIAKPDDIDAISIENMGEVTTANAKKQLDTISSLLTKYSSPDKGAANA